MAQALEEESIPAPRSPTHGWVREVILISQTHKIFNTTKFTT